MSIACIWLFFSCIFIVKAINESKIYDGLENNSPINKNTALGQKIANIQNTIQANDAIKNQEYEKALQLITGDSSEDYYNRGTIQTLLAYKDALQSNISWLENAQIVLAQAKQNFDVAKKLSISPTTTNAIIENQKTIESLSTVVDIKTCYGIWQTIITNVKDIISNIKDIQNTLDEEEKQIKINSKLDTPCYQKLTYIVNTSKKQINLFQLQMEKNTTNYISDFSDKIENPMICVQNPYENILPSILKGKQWIEEYKQQHINTIKALQSNTSENIQQLCNQAKNDAQINQEIQSSVQELLQKLEDNKDKSQEQKRSTNEAKYKDFFNENEKKALQNIKSTNQGWIETILNIRGKSNYNPEQYINDMFNQFYGNSGDFIDLHK